MTLTHVLASRIHVCRKISGLICFFFCLSSEAVHIPSNSTNTSGGPIFFVQLTIAAASIKFSARSSFGFSKSCRAENLHNFHPWKHTSQISKNKNLKIQQELGFHPHTPNRLLKKRTTNIILSQNIEIHIGKVRRINYLLRETFSIDSNDDPTVWKQSVVQFEIFNIFILWICHWRYRNRYLWNKLKMHALRI